MNDILLENYIREVLYNEESYNLNEISLKDFSPKTTLEAGLQAGILSILAIFGNDLSKKNKLPSDPTAQAEEIIDQTRKNFKARQLLDNSNLQSVKSKLAKKLEQEPIEDIHKRISSSKERKIRDWLSNKEGGYAVSYDDHILSRADYDYFNKLNDDRINHGREPITMEKYVKYLEAKKKEDAQEKRKEEIFDKSLSFDDDGMPSFDHSLLGIDTDGNFNKEKFVEDSIGMTQKIFELEDSGAFDKESRKKLKKTRRSIEKASSLISYLDENGEWQDGIVMSKEDAQRAYEFADQEVKEIVKQHYPYLEET